MTSEIGRRLKASELKAGEIVVIVPPGQDPAKPAIAMTMWVADARRQSVLFRAGEINTHVINSVRDDGEVVDDRGRVVEVYAYLGEP